LMSLAQPSGCFSLVIVYLSIPIFWQLANHRIWYVSLSLFSFTLVLTAALNALPSFLPNTLLLILKSSHPILIVFCSFIYVIISMIWLILCINFCHWIFDSTYFWSIYVSKHDDFCFSVLLADSTLLYI
jgi:hypothetical protein